MYAVHIIAISGRHYECRSGWHDTLYENQQQWDMQALRDYAEKLLLDVERFMDDTNSEIYAARVRHDFQTGLMSGVNGKRYDGAWDLESLMEVIEKRGR